MLNLYLMSVRKTQFLTQSATKNRKHVLLLNIITDEKYSKHMSGGTNLRALINFIVWFASYK